MKNNKPDFSIITVVKNNEKRILTTLKSVQIQSFKNYEHIVVDGFSKDKTGQIIDKHKDENTIFLKYKDKNLYDAINFALKKIRGNYVLFLHSGDIFFSKNTLAKLSNIIDNNTDVILGGCIFFNKRNKITRIWLVKDDAIDITNSYKIPHTGAVISRKIINKLGLYDIRYNISSDTDYLLRLFSKKINIKILSDFVCFMEDGGLSTSYKNFCKKCFQDILIYYKYFGVYALLKYISKILSKITHFNNQHKSLDYQFKLNDIINDLNKF